MRDAMFSRGLNRIPHMLGLVVSPHDLLHVIIEGLNAYLTPQSVHRRSR